MSDLWEISRITIEDRHRRNLGDIKDLAASIKAVGLINPVTITPEGRLIAGHRRIEAHRYLGRDAIQCRVVDTLTSARDLLVAERDENTCRMEMKPSELVALGRALEELERPKAEERRAAAGAQNLPNASAGHQNSTSEVEGKGYTRNIVGQALGMSGSTYGRAKAVVEAAESDPRPDVREIAKAAVREMDDTGKVTAAFNKVAEVTGRTPVGRKPKQKPVERPPAPPKFGSRRKHIEMLDAVNVGLSGYAEGLDEITELDASVTAEEAARIRGDLSKSIRSLSRINNLIKERSAT